MDIFFSISAATSFQFTSKILSSLEAAGARELLKNETYLHLPRQRPLLFKVKKTKKITWFSCFVFVLKLDCRAFVCSVFAAKKVQRGPLFSFLSFCRGQVKNVPINFERKRGKEKAFLLSASSSGMSMPGAEAGFQKGKAFRNRPLRFAHFSPSSSSSCPRKSYLF